MIMGSKNIRVDDEFEKILKEGYEKTRNYLKKHYDIDVSFVEYTRMLSKVMFVSPYLIIRIYDGNRKKKKSIFDFEW